MVILKIDSHLTHFKFLEKMNRRLAGHICGEASLNGLPVYTVLEAMAQLAALEVRIHFNFDRHAFLLKVIQSRWPASPFLSDRFYLDAKQLGQSQNTFSYAVKAKGLSEGLELNAELLIGTMPYDSDFRKKTIQPYYQKMVEKFEFQRDGYNG